MDRRLAWNNIRHTLEYEGENKQLILQTISYIIHSLQTTYNILLVLLVLFRDLPFQVILATQRGIFLKYLLFFC